MKNIVLPLSALLFFSLVYAQEDLSLKYANSITSEELKDHLSILASDALEGRETGERGQKMAATYIEHYFKSNNLEPIVNTPSGFSYLQSFDLVKIMPTVGWIKVVDETYNIFEDIVYTGNRNFNEPVRSTLVFIGEGNPNDYEALAAEGKNVLIYSTGDRIYRAQKAEMAYQKGAKNVFIIQEGSSDNFNRMVNMYKRYASTGKLTLTPEPEEAESGYFLISELLGASILNTDEKILKNAVEKSRQGKYASLIKLKSKEITFYARQEIEQVSTENVLGFIEGTDKKNEYIIITAHYDHVGKDGEKIYNGADDDGSGTVAVMEIAQAFAFAMKEGNSPRRSILFMTVSGEEKGLLGSSYYVTHPLLPIEHTIANLNIDMIGRVDEKHVENPNYIYLIGSDKLSTELHALSEKTNATYSKLELDYMYNADSDPNRFYYRSDHYNFAKNNIPVIFYFNGTHEDYHKPTDTVDKIEFNIFEKRVRLIFHTAWEIANREDRIMVDVNPEELSIESSN